VAEKCPNRGFSCQISLTIGLTYPQNPRYPGHPGRAPRRRHRQTAPSSAGPDAPLPRQEEHRQDAGPKEGPHPRPKECQGGPCPQNLEVDAFVDEHAAAASGRQEGGGAPCSRGRREAAGRGGEARG